MDWFDQIIGNRQLAIGNRPLPITHRPLPSILLYAFPMGFTFRKSKSFGPFRVNMSRSGVGFSVGGKGFRTGVSSRGKRYSTFSIPGTGIGYNMPHGGGGRRAKSKTGCLIFVVPIGMLALIAVGVSR
jgi:hypothetical protein